MSTHPNDGGPVTLWKGSIYVGCDSVTVALDGATFKRTPKLWKRLSEGVYGDAFGFGTNFDREPGFADRSSAAQAEIALARKRIEKMERDIELMRVGIEQMESLVASGESY